MPNDTPGGYIRAEVRWEFDRRANAVGKTAVVDDPGELGRLLTFFPGLGTHERSFRSGGWKRGFFILFTSADGSTLPVSVSPRFNHWHEGAGDWPLAPEFAGYVEKLFGISVL